MRAPWDTGHGIWDRVAFFGGGSSGTQTVQQTTAPNPMVQPYLGQALAGAQQVYQTPQQYFPNSTVVPFSNQTEQGLTDLENRGANGSPLQSAFQGNLTDTLNGNFLNSNPYLDATFDQAAGKVRSALDSQFNSAGRLNSGGNQAASADAYNNLATQIYGGNYANERTNQLRAGALAPSGTAMDYQNIGAQLQAGSTREGQAQQQLQDQINRYNFAQQEPQQRTQNYLAALSGGQFGNTATSQQPIYSNTLGQTLGAGLGIASLGNSLFGTGGGTQSAGLLRGLFS